MALLCPLFFVNGGLIEEPESYRCHVWFVSAVDGKSVVSLVDVTRESLEGLREVSNPVHLRRVVRVLLDGSDLAALM